MQCGICELGCEIRTGGTGRCGMYTLADGELREKYPGRYLAAVETAIESMPMVHFHPRGTFLQVCTVGCNFKCPGCVSEILTDHLGAIRGQFQELGPEQVLDKAEKTGCLGIMFCFNEPTVSFFTFRDLARKARERGLLAGCATNGYMTARALEELIPHLDFVNVGLKGAWPETCRACGIPDAAPVFRNMKTLFERGVHLEVSAVFRKGHEAEVEEGAAYVAGLSRAVPFQVMRFLPFGRTGVDEEPSVREAEALCARLRKQLDHVFLFNTPGTSWLDSRCPDCGETVLARGFFGPMCANLHRYTPDGRCRCGRLLPLTGRVHDTDLKPSGYFGGYRTINALNMIRSILALLGVRDKAVMETVMTEVLRTDLIKSLYRRLNRIDPYLDTVDDLAALAGKKDRARRFREYVLCRVEEVRRRVRGREAPAVYLSLGHPLIAMFEEKMESHLVTVAGGMLTNRLIRREDRPGITIEPAEFLRLAPRTIFISDGIAWPPRDFAVFCHANGLAVPAVREGRIFWLHPYRCSTNPDWVLGLLALANHIHPDCFDFDLIQEADRFYLEFYGHRYNGGILPAFPWEEKPS